MSGRPSTVIDWDQVREVVRAGARHCNQAAAALQIQAKTLAKACLKIHEKPFRAWAREVREEARLPLTPFSDREYKALVRAYYSGHLARTDFNDYLKQPKGGQGPREFSDPTTGTNLIATLTYPQMDSIMQILQTASVSIGGVSVADGYEYVLRAWVDPRQQDENLPAIVELYERGDVSEWRETPTGMEIIPLALIALNKELTKRVFNYPRHLWGIKPGDTLRNAFYGTEIATTEPYLVGDKWLIQSADSDGVIRPFDCADILSFQRQNK